MTQHGVWRVSQQEHHQEVQDVQQEVEINDLYELNTHDMCYIRLLWKN